MKIFFDQMESAVILFYRVVLIILTVTVIVAAVFLIRYVEQGFWDQGGGLYITLALLAFFGWVIGQSVSLARRQRLMTLPPVKFTKTEDGPTHTFTFTMGAQGGQTADRSATAGASATLSKSSTVGASGAPADTRPTQAQIEQADGLQREGHDWESICNRINPRYIGWPPTERQVYNVLLQALVAARRAHRGDTR